VKRLVKVLEEVAEGEQAKMIEQEMAEKPKLQEEESKIPETNINSARENITIF